MAETILTDQDNGRSIEAQVGASLIVRLEESPTTGYVWINKTADDVLHLNSSEFSSASLDAVGGTGGIDTLRLFLYKTTRNLLGWTGDTGAYLRTTLEALVLFGVPPENYWQYDASNTEQPILSAI